MKKSRKTKAAPQAPDYYQETVLTMREASLRRLINLARDEQDRERMENFEAITRVVNLHRAQLLCARMGWPVQVAQRLAGMDLRRPLPSDRVVCIYTSGIAEGCSYSEPLKAGRIYVVRDLPSLASVRLVGILGGLDEHGFENSWIVERFFVLDDVKEAFAAVRAAQGGVSAVE